jgi:hypothetical protein
LVAFLVVAIPLSILTGESCNSKEPTTDLRIRMAFVLATVAAVSAAALILFETWIAYFIFNRPKEGLPAGVERFLRLQRAGGLVVGSFLVGIAGTWATMVALVFAVRLLHLPLPFQGGKFSATEGLYILLAVIFFAIWGSIYAAIWTWLLRRGYRIR